MSDCAICLVELNPMVFRNITLFCNHSFHRDCLNKWLQVNRSCPMCRSCNISKFDLLERHMKRCSEIMLRKLADYRKKIEQERVKVKAFKKELKGKLALATALKTHTALSIAYSFKTSTSFSSTLKEPFSYINGRKIWSYKRKEDVTYQLKDIIQFIPEEEHFEIGDFPHNITKCYWIYDEDDFCGPWYMLCQISTLTGPAYAFYSARADWDTGFDIIEYTSMSLIVSKSQEKLLNKGIPESMRSLLLENKASRDGLA